MGDMELGRFLRIARGSANEVECQLLLARDLEYLTVEEWEPLNSDCRLISAMLSRLAASLRKKPARKAPRPRDSVTP